MKYTVKVEETSYEVEIEDIHARPVIARVNGERFEIYPENGIKPEIAQEAKPFNLPEPPRPVVTPGASCNELTAPLPGTIVEVFVKAGEEIEAGHVVLVIEAMKMKNSIRSTRSGKIAEVLVSIGQTVAHKQALVKFE
jgi:glutaconyl-CoA/methylmalonyl-CoA decarboxylase subunit gamma